MKDFDMNRVSEEKMWSIFPLVLRSVERDGSQREHKSVSDLVYSFGGGLEDSAWFDLNLLIELLEEKLYGVVGWDFFQF